MMPNAKYRYFKITAAVNSETEQVYPCGADRKTVRILADEQY